MRKQEGRKAGARAARQTRVGLGAAPCIFGGPSALGQPEKKWAGQADSKPGGLAELGGRGVSVEQAGWVGLGACVGVGVVTVADRDQALPVTASGDESATKKGSEKRPEWETNFPPVSQVSQPAGHTASQTVRKSVCQSVTQSVTFSRRDPSVRLLCSTLACRLPSAI